MLLPFMRRCARFRLDRSRLRPDGQLHSPSDCLQCRHIDGNQKIPVDFKRANAELTLQRKLGLKSVEYVLERCHACGGLLNP